MKPLLPTALALLLAGCTTAGDLGGEVQSVTDAGITDILVEPVVAAGVRVGTRYKATLGKEYGSFEFVAEFADGLPVRVEVRATSVESRDVQGAAVAAAVAIRQSLTEQGIEITSEISAAILDGVLRGMMP